MYRFDLITIFPEIFSSYFNESILKRAQRNKIVKITIHNLRNFTKDKHKKVDDRPYGGGPGMVMSVNPIVRALKKIVGRKQAQTRIILTSAKGKRFTQSDAHRLAKFKHLIFVCGHYEGVDERVTHYIDEELSIGDYVLTGGELAAAVMSDAIIRLLPNVLGDAESNKDESHEKKGILEYPQYTRPEVYEGRRVPKILLSGDHKKIHAWREKHRKKSV